MVFWMTRIYRRSRLARTQAYQETLGFNPITPTAPWFPWPCEYRGHPPCISNVSWCDGGPLVAVQAGAGLPCYLYLCHDSIKQSVFGNGRHNIPSITLQILYSIYNNMQYSLYSRDVSTLLWILFYNNQNIYFENIYCVIIQFNAKKLVGSV